MKVMTSEFTSSATEPSLSLSSLFSLSLSLVVNTFADAFLPPTEILAHLESESGLQVERRVFF